MPTKKQIFIILALSLVVLLPRIFDLGAFMTADEKRWVAGTAGFTKNLSLLKWDKLMQWPHPGITTHWLGAISIHANSLAAQKLPLAIGQSILIGLIAYVSYRLWGKRPATLLTLLLALNPFLIAHTRVYAMDSLLALFLLLSVISLLLWKKTNTTRYLAFSAIAATLAVLSKLPGIIIIPFSLLIISRPRPAAKWLTIFAITLVIVFPSILLNFSEVTHQLQEFFPAENARLTHHTENSYTYYLETLIFFSTPLHIVALIILLIILAKDWRQKNFKYQAIILFLFAALFIVQMTLGAKKGDRYILPSFLFLDTLVVITFFSLIKLFKTRRLLLVTSYCLLVTGLLLQAFDIARLHPHTLAYVNPITKPFYGDRRLGWGEGLDVAANYLNQKPEAFNLKVASMYPTEFAYNFVGEVIPLNHYEGSNADYVILYRALLKRGDAAWETDILNFFADKNPEKTIQLNGLDYIWIHPYQLATQ